MGTAASWNESLYSEGWLPAAFISQPEVSWVVGSGGHALELPKAGVFPWPSADSLASTWWQFIFGSCRVWAVLVMVCQHQPQLCGTPLPPCGSVLHLLPLGSCLFPASCACLGQGSPECHQRHGKGLQGTHRTHPLSQCPSERAHRLRGLSKQLVKSHVLSPLCCFLLIVTRCWGQRWGFCCLSTVKSDLILNTFWKINLVSACHPKQFVYYSLLKKIM